MLSLVNCGVKFKGTPKEDTGSLVLFARTTVSPVEKTQLMVQNIFQILLSSNDLMMVDSPSFKYDHLTSFKLGLLYKGLHQLRKCNWPLPEENIIL